MEDLNRFPETLSCLHNTLESFIKPRKTVIEVRKILRLYLSSHIETTNQQLVNRPLLLPESSFSVKGSIHGVKGLQRDYLRCLDLNLKARNEYTRLSSEQRATGIDDALDTALLNAISNDESISPIGSFSDLIRKRHRQARLKVIHNFIEKLSQKPAACNDYFDPRKVLRLAPNIPQVPPELMQPVKIDRYSTDIRMGVLISHLEKAVFVARKNLNREQKLLSNTKFEYSVDTANQNTRIFALETTRNELIRWIENELSITDEMLPDTSDHAPHDARFQLHFLPIVKKSLESVYNLYFKYIAARKLLLKYCDDIFRAQTSDHLETKEIIESEGKKEISNTMNLIYPYYSELVSLSNQQKVFVQQKLHLTTNLSKKLEEANQGFERLAQESHLLPLYPVPISESHRRQRDGSISFAEAISSQERPETSRQARLWVHAAHSASHTTSDVVLQNSEKGNSSLSKARSDLAELDLLLGIATGGHVSTARHDLWSDINTNIDRIKAEVFESD